MENWRSEKKFRIQSLDKKIKSHIFVFLWTWPGVILSLANTEHLLFSFLFSFFCFYVWGIMWCVCVHVNAAYKCHKRTHPLMLIPVFHLVLVWVLLLLTAAYSKLFSPWIFGGASFFSSHLSLESDNLKSGPHACTTELSFHILCLFLMLCPLDQAALIFTI